MNGLPQIETRQPLSTTTALDQPLADQTQTDSTPKAKLYQKLLGVMADCDYIKKDKYNGFFKYSYASEAAIKERVHTSLAKHRLLFLHDILSHERITGLGKDGKDVLTVIETRYRFIDADSGESVEGTSFGSGIDSADKGLYKAITGSLKYILTSTFLIATGDDPEEDQQKPPVTHMPAVAPKPPVPAPKPAASAQADEKPWRTAGDMKRLFSEVREMIGETEYDAVLRQYEVLTPSDFLTPAKRHLALPCYRELLVKRNAEVA